MECGKGLASILQLPLEPISSIPLIFCHLLNILLSMPLVFFFHLQAGRESILMGHLDKARTSEPLPLQG